MPGADDNKDNQDGTGAVDDKNKPNPDATGGKDGKGADDDSKPLGFKSVEEAEAEVKKLRKENASRRTTNKTLEERVTASEATMGKLKQALGIENEETPEVVAQNLKGENAALQLELEITRLAVQHQIPPDQSEYFNFLFQKKLSTLSESEEMTDEQIAEVVSKVKALSPAPAKKTTGMENGKEKPAPTDGDETVTIEAFVKMNPGERSGLYQSHPKIYERLFDEAKTKRLL